MYADRTGAEIARPDSLDRIAERARATVLEQARAVSALADRMDRAYARAVQLLLRTRGHVVVLGVGKSGHIGRKIAATLASTGTPSFFVHPTEAFHGDLGMITERDAVVLISCSGETEEVVRLLPHLERAGIPIIALVGKLGSTLSERADVALDVSVEREACPHNLAPTTSTLAALAMGDALAISLMEARSFDQADFARLHPGGSLGRRLLSRVADLMHKGDLPMVSPEQTVRDSLFTITRGRLGLVLVMKRGKLCGIVTDGDLRRAMQKHEDILSVPVSKLMSPRPVCIREDARVAEAEELMREHKIKAVVVVDERGAVAGIIDTFQL
jgi:arabinose-5-phosphate isomerase